MPPLPALDPGLIAGVAAYRRHAWQRTTPDPPAVWHEEDTRMLDFGTADAGPPVLFVPSLVNRAYVLDLLPERSMMRAFAEQGVRPLLLDWGWPGPVERAFTLTDYIAGRLERAIAAVGEPVVLAGYCMGGLLALAVALRRPDRLRGRLLEGTAVDMFNSLQKLAALDGDTLVCCGHEYTQANARFALHVDAGNTALQARAAEVDRLRAAGQATVPSRLRDELQANPFLRAPNAGKLGQLRSQKDTFR